MVDSDVFPDIEQDNNPLFYHQPQLPARPPGKNEAHDTEGFVEFSLADLVKDSLGLSQRIKKMLASPTVQIDAILTERIVNSSIVVYLVELKAEKHDPIIVKRRYSEFKSLRDNLIRLFPTVVMPPIPEKHTLLTYLLNSIDNSKELLVIDVRKRYFRKFLSDLVLETTPQVRSCPLVAKFFDPGYELCWENAVHEPPVSFLPQNLLLANPIDPPNQNGLYLLLPSVTGFDLTATDNLPSLKKLDDDLHKLHSEVRLAALKDMHASELPDEEAFFGTIPASLIKAEKDFHQNIKVLTDLHRLNAKNIRTWRLRIDVLIELGGNLNNFSLQIHEMVTADNNQLSLLIERFGLTIDSTFLTYEHFLHGHIIPKWEEPINQFLQYNHSALQVAKFYKYKLLQYKLLYKLKFHKALELSHSHSPKSLKHLKDLNINSPSISSAIERMEQKQRKHSLSGKRSWYGLFGGNKASFSLPEEPHSASAVDHNGQPAAPGGDHIEKELAKLEQLILLANEDMAVLTSTLVLNFDEFRAKMEKKWLMALLDFVRAGKQVFTDNLASWSDLKDYVDK